MPAKKKRPIAPEDNYLARNVFDPQISPDGRRVAYVVRVNDRESDERQNRSGSRRPMALRRRARFTHGKAGPQPALVAGRASAWRSSPTAARRDRSTSRRSTAGMRGSSRARSTASTSWRGRRTARASRTSRARASTRSRRTASGAEKAAPRVIRNLRYRLDGIGYFDNRRTHIFVADVESGEAKQITDGDWYDQQPSWSPDGKSIVFASDRERQRHDRQFRSDVWLVASTGGKRAQAHAQPRRGEQPVVLAGRPLGRVHRARARRRRAWRRTRTSWSCRPAASARRARSARRSTARSQRARPAVRIAWLRGRQGHRLPGAGRRDVALYRARHGERRRRTKCSAASARSAQFTLSRDGGARRVHRVVHVDAAGGVHDARSDRRTASATSATRTMSCSRRPSSARRSA